MLPFCERVINVERAKYLPSHNRSIPVPKEPKTIGEHLRKRRLELGIFQSEAARRLRVSTVTLSRWECDKVHPTWPQQPAVIAYLGFDPFTNPALGSPKGNETRSVAFLPSGALANIGQAIIRHSIKMRKTRKQFAQELGVSPKTVWNWKTGRRHPSHVLRKRIVAFLGLFTAAPDRTSLPK